MAKQARGYKSSMMVDFEASFGEAPKKKAGYVLPMNSNELVKNQTLIESDTITKTRNDSQPALGRVSVEGDIVMPADYVAIGYMLKALFGAPVTSGEEATKTHTFTVGDDQPSMIVEKGFPDLNKYIRYTGVKINIMKLEYGQDQEMTISYNVMGAAREQSGTAYTSSPTVVPLQRIAQNDAYIKIGGTESRIVKEGSIEINANLDGDQYVVGGGGVRGDIPEGIMKVNGTIKALFTDTEWLDKADNGESVPVEIGFKRADGTTLSFTMPTVQFEPFDAPISGPAGVTVDVTWRAFSADGTSIVTVVVKNNQVSY